MRFVSTEDFQRLTNMDQDTYFMDALESDYNEEIFETKEDELIKLVSFKFLGICTYAAHDEIYGEWEVVFENAFSETVQFPIDEIL